MSLLQIPFSRPFRSGNEEERISATLRGDLWQGDGPATEHATRLLEQVAGARRALLTTSCTHALELASLVLDLGPGDEVIVPSFTFPSTASAISARGATPVFVDVLPHTLNLDVSQAEAAVTERTKAVYVIHYAGVAADVDLLSAMAGARGLEVVEDNAHGLGGAWRGRPLGTFGAMATQSFHATKNVTCGEGGALLVNDPSLDDRAEIIREKGTNRAQFLRGEVDKYTWVDQGSSYLISDVLAALLGAQLESFAEIQELRHDIWLTYHQRTASWAADQGVEVMTIPDGADHSAHMFYMVMPTAADQTALLHHMRVRGVGGTFHYQPLHRSPAGRRYGRSLGDCPVTVSRSRRLVRLPLFAGMTVEEVERVVDAVTSYMCGVSGQTVG